MGESTYFRSIEAVSIISLPFGLIGEIFVGLGNLPKLLFGEFFVVGVFVGVPFDGELLVGFFYLLGGGFFIDSEHLVVISLLFRHRLLVIYYTITAFQSLKIDYSRIQNLYSNLLFYSPYFPYLRNNAGENINPPTNHNLPNNKKEHSMKPLEAYRHIISAFG